MYNQARRTNDYSDPDPRVHSKKEKNLNSLRDFKIHSNTVSPNPSGIRSKKPSRESILNDQHNSRKGLYRNQNSHIRKNHIDNSNVERHSFNHTSDIRRNMSERSDRSDFKAIKDKSYISNKSNRLNINSGAKAKIKQMISGRDSNINMDGNKMDQYSSSKRKSHQKIFEGVLEYNGKKLHKKSNSLKSDVMNKYFIKGGRNNSVNNEDLLNKSAGDGDNSHISNRQISSSQQRRGADLGDYGDKMQNLSGTNFHGYNGGGDKLGTNNGNIKVNSFLNSKNSGAMGMLSNNIDNRKNLNEKILNKYKKSGIYGNAGGNNKINTSNSHDISMSKSEYSKNYGGIDGRPDNSFQGTKTAGLYDKFISTKIKKSNLIPPSSNAELKNNYPLRSNMNNNLDNSLNNSSNTPINNSNNNPEYLTNNLITSNNPANQKPYNSSSINQSNYNNNASSNKKNITASHRKTESLNANPSYYRSTNYSNEK